MATTTDPANELAGICKRLSSADKSAGSSALGNLFGFDGYSTEYYRIIASIMRRADQVEEVLANSHLDPDHKDLARGTLADFKSMFSATYLNQAWSAGGSAKAASLYQAITFLSGTVRNYVKYPALSEDEAKEIIDEIHEYLGYLNSRTNDELPFIKRSIEESLYELIFRLNNLGWLGADYTLSAIRDVNEAYRLMERGGYPNNGEEPVYTKLGAILGGINEKLSTAREWKENAAMILEGYKFVAAISMPLMSLTPLLMGPK